MNLGSCRLDVASDADVLRAAGRARLLAERLGADEERQRAFAAAVLEAAAYVRERCRAGRIALEARLDGEAVVLHAHAAGRCPETAAGTADETLPNLLTSAGAADRCRIRREGSHDVVIDLALALEPDRARLDAMPAAAFAAADDDPVRLGYEAARQANAALLAALREARESRDACTRMSQELEETNRGVVALYAELDERADELRRADRAKTRFLSNVSHELRTPLNAIRALCGLLLDRADGPLTDEQAKQVGFIRGAADDLRQLVDDLLDLAKIAAAKVDVSPARFEIADLFGALRGMLKPLLTDNAVSLHFEDASQLPAMTSDEAKVSQILRNLISNALKFTAAGEVRVSAAAVDDGRSLRFVVADTGIGIAAADRERIFEEFTQIANPLQARSKGTGLGLPLCRRLAHLLGGSVTVESEPGQGSTFTVVLPRIHAPAQSDAAQEPASGAPGIDRAAPGIRASAPSTAPRVLLVDDDPAARYALRRCFEEAGATVLEAADGSGGLQLLATVTPDLVLLDLQLPDMSGEDVLHRLRTADSTRHLPVAIVTSLDLDEARRGALRARDAAAIVSKRDIGTPDFCSRLLALASTGTHTPS